MPGFLPPPFPMSLLAFQEGFYFLVSQSCRNHLSTRYKLLAQWHYY
jgi:hypothetical protein